MEQNRDRLTYWLIMLIIFAIILAAQTWGTEQIGKLIANVFSNINVIK